MLPAHVAVVLQAPAALLSSLLGTVGHHSGAALCCVCQVDFVKLLMEQLNYLHTKYADTPHASQFPRPSFKVRTLDIGQSPCWCFWHNRRHMVVSV
jgi:hypothetical protein